jgi:hypothetical protein
VEVTAGDRLTGPVIVEASVILVASAVPGANEALAAGHAARAAAHKARMMRAELDRRLARPLPETPRERGWAVANRGRYALEWGDAEREAGRLCSRWDELMDALRETSPATADEVDEAVWGSGA